jgi:hypothetical protein
MATIKITATADFNGKTFEATASTAKLASANLFDTLIANGCVESLALGLSGHKITTKKVNEVSEIKAVFTEANKAQKERAKELIDATRAKRDELSANIMFVKSVLGLIKAGDKAGEMVAKLHAKYCEKKTVSKAGFKKLINEACNALLGEKLGLSTRETEALCTLRNICGHK